MSTEKEIAEAKFREILGAAEQQIKAELHPGIAIAVVMYDKQALVPMAVYGPPTAEELAHILGLVCDQFKQRGGR